MWLHEIKHDGFRVIARKQDPRVRLYSRPGNDLTERFPASPQSDQCSEERVEVSRDND
jgi:ATP-dependent DNA ligase